MPRTMPPIFVISLARDVERRAAIRQELAEFEFEFFDAVDGDKLDEEEHRHRMQTEWWRVMRGRELAPGQIGCLLSNWFIWQRMVEARTPHAIVLQDDARLEDEFAVTIEEIMKADVEWDIVQLAPKRQYRIDRVLAVLDSGRRLVRYRRRFGGAVGYIIRMEAAEVLLHYCWRIRAPIDWLYAEWWQNGLVFLAVEPAIVRHAGVPPSIKTKPKGIIYLTAQKPGARLVS
ncbi:MAG: glycosyltransferase family 25 protein [Alphaproteobacteria bacterium]|nr:glycosyltransferase family 25 protein [Alphaproteobacteria bacterium]